MVNDATYKLAWRFAAVLSCCVWIIVLIINFAYFSTQKTGVWAKDLFNNIAAILLYGSTVIASVVLIVIPLSFYIYAFFCCLHGIVHLVDRGSAPGVLMYLLGVAFAFKQGFFEKDKQIKITGLILILVAAILSQIRKGFLPLITTTLQCLSVFMIGFLLVMIFLPDLQKIMKTKETSVLRLSPTLFTYRDAKILQDIIVGKKYEAIASEHNIAVSTLKNNLSSLYKKLGVSNRNAFLAKYSNYTIKLDIPDPAPGTKPSSWSE
ncbi:LuxR C-terminal-related transcriptional regulator [Brucepastera parasyntrophica]|uniref:helix-turn-helix transcriptional regulator n=1 Tax=Brucepastera parasyntrophica TaxID=2880008 RepID=UPI00210C8D0C|nr:LuxR C-terminal-related transcriptional regulator [Brucepastera parasyntrophica]ULQ59910.1 LuxR C-terminal-related transcriptional regulator [Brucepastera parasyntrophica]